MMTEIRPSQARASVFLKYNMELRCSEEPSIREGHTVRESWVSSELEKIQQPRLIKVLCCILSSAPPLPPLLQSPLIHPSSPLRYFYSFFEDFIHCTLIIANPNSYPESYKIHPHLPTYPPKLCVF